MMQPHQTMRCRRTGPGLCRSRISQGSRIVPHYPADLLRPCCRTTNIDPPRWSAEARFRAPGMSASNQMRTSTCISASYRCSTSGSEKINNVELAGGDADAHYKFLPFGPLTAS